MCVCVCVCVYMSLILDPNFLPEPPLFRRGFRVSPPQFPLGDLQAVGAEPGADDVGLPSVPSVKPGSGEGERGERGRRGERELSQRPRWRLRVRSISLYNALH